MTRSSGSVEIIDVSAATFDLIPRPGDESHDCLACSYWEGKRPQHARWRREAFDGGILNGMVALVDGVPAGFCQYGPLPSFPAAVRNRSEYRTPVIPGSWVVTCLAVRPEHRRRGVATALLDACARRCRELGASLEAMVLDDADHDQVSGGHPGVYSGVGFERLETTDTEMGPEGLYRLREGGR